jgi:hypothetical protein
VAHRRAFDGRTARALEQPSRSRCAEETVHRPLVTPSFLAAADLVVGVATRRHASHGSGGPAAGPYYTADNPKIVSDHRARISLWHARCASGVVEHDLGASRVHLDKHVAMMWRPYGQNMAIM